VQVVGIHRDHWRVLQRSWVNSSDGLRCCVVHVVEETSRYETIIILIDRCLSSIHILVESWAHIVSNPIEVRAMVKINVGDPGPVNELTNLLNRASTNNLLHSGRAIRVGVVSPSCVDGGNLGVPLLAVVGAVVV